MDLQKRFLKLTSTSGSGDYSYTQNRTLEFQLSGSGRAILSEMRLKGNFLCQITPTGDAIRNVRIADLVQLNNNCGLQAVIQRIRIRSLGLSSKIMETIEDYPRMVSALNCCLNSKCDFDTELSHGEWSRGFGQSSDRNVESRLEFLGLGTRTADNGSPSVKNGKIQRVKQVANAPTLARSGQILQQRKMLIGERAFSLRLYSGILMSNNVSIEDIQGLSISIDLNDPNDVFKVAGGVMTYVLKNVELMIPVVDDNTPRTPNTSLNFLSFVTTKKNLTSTSQTTSDTLNMNGVLGMLSSYVPSGYVNNSAVDGHANYNPNIKNIEWLVNGSRYPLSSQIRTKYNDALEPHVQQNESPEILRNALSSLKPFGNYSKTSVGAPTNNWRANKLGFGSFFSGVSFDQVSGLGVSLDKSVLQQVSSQALRSPSGGADQNYRMHNFYVTRQQVDIVNNNVQVSV